MNVGELRKALEGVDDSLEVIVRTETEQGDSYCGTPEFAAVEDDHDPEDPAPAVYFAIDCGPDEDHEEKQAPRAPLRIVDAPALASAPGVTAAIAFAPLTGVPGGKR
ncbi:MAG TPA: hypothetical protein VG734_25465 [Lacunisphaera sp.]|nr:hypothetical protein [Lacunisphaera sp.]